MATTLQNLIDYVRQRCNIENSQVVTDAELTTYLNSSLGQLDDELITTSDDYKLNSSDFVIASNGDNNNTFTLPADFLKERAVEKQIDTAGNRWATLGTFTLQQRNAFAVPIPVYPYGVPMGYYRIRGNVCEIIPADLCSGTYRLWYVPRWTDLAVTDSLPVYMDTQHWSEYAVVDTAIKVLMKQDLDASQYMAVKQELKQHILNAAKPRNQGPPKVVADMDHQNNWGPRGMFRF